MRRKYSSTRTSDYVLVIILLAAVGYVILTEGFKLLDTWTGSITKESGVVIDKHYEQAYYSRAYWDDADYVVTVRCSDGSVQSDEVSSDYYYNAEAGDSVTYYRRWGGFTDQTRYIRIQEQP